jgi:hypothetical protein
MTALGAEAHSDPEHFSGHSSGGSALLRLIFHLMQWRPLPPCLKATFRSE